MNRVRVQLSFLALLLFGSARPVSTQAAGPPVVELRRSDGAGLELQVAAPPYALVERQAAGQTFLALEAEQLAGGSPPGQPQLPTAGQVLALPPGTEPRWQLTQIDLETVKLAHPLLPAPTPLPADGGVGGAVVYAPEPAAYRTDAPFPPDWVILGQPGRLRGVEVVPLTIAPFRYNPVRGELLVLRRATLAVSFVPRSSPGPAAAPPPSGPFATLLASSTLNFRDLPAEGAARPPAPAAAAPASGPTAYKIAVDADGLYRLTYGDLAAAGLPVGGGPGHLDPRTLRLRNRGQELAIWVTGEADGRFDPGDELRFPGFAARTRFSAKNVYWLSYGGAPGRRLETVDAAPTGGAAGPLFGTAYAEQNRRYEPLHRAADGDHWYWQKLSAPASVDVALALQTPNPAAGPATLQVRLYGATGIDALSPDHHLRLRVNGNPAGDVWWDGIAPYTATVTVPGAWLRPGENTVSLSLPADTGAPIDDVLLDAIRLEYGLSAAAGDPRFFHGLAASDLDYALGGFGSNPVLLFEVGDPFAGRRLTGAGVDGNGRLAFHFQSGAAAPRFLAVAGTALRSPLAIAPAPPPALRQPGNGADYLIISHADFIPALAPLVAHRRSAAGGSHRVQVVDVSQVYDEFSDGLLDPQAIRDFLAYAYDSPNWNPAPAFVLLVGDGTLDFRNYNGNGSLTFIPPYLAMVDRYWGETASDNRYATVDGPDPLADYFIGRLPVNTPLEAATVVNKIIAYETAPPGGLWPGQLLFASDNPDDAGDFHATSDAVYGQYVPPFLGRQVYLGRGYASGPEAKGVILRAWNEGAGLVVFNGHSSWHQWAVENMLHFNDVPSLTNGGRLPLVLAMTCFTGYFQHPAYGTLDEALVRQAGGGAIATFSATGLGVATGHDWLFRGFFRAVVDEGATQLGPAVAAAKLNLYGGSLSPVDRELIDTFLILGDPALQLNLNADAIRQRIYLPLVRK